MTERNKEFPFLVHSSKDQFEAGQRAGDNDSTGMAVAQVLVLASPVSPDTLPGHWIGDSVAET